MRSAQFSVKTKVLQIAPTATTTTSARLKIMWSLELQSPALISSWHQLFVIVTMHLFLFIPSQLKVSMVAPVLKCKPSPHPIFRQGLGLTLYFTPPFHVNSKTRVPPENQAIRGRAKFFFDYMTKLKLLAEISPNHNNGD